MKEIKKIIIVLLVFFMIGCSNKNSTNQESESTESETSESETSESETSESETSELNTTEYQNTIEQSTESEKNEIRYGSKSDPIPLGESYTYKFAIPNYSYTMDDLAYGNATIKILSANDNIEIEVKFDSCNKDVAIQLGREILDGSYFTIVSENFQECSLLRDDIYTEPGEFFNIYNPIYPGGTTLVYVKNNNAKYLVVHHNVYADDDNINNPDSIEIETDNGIEYELRYYTTWFLLD